MKLDRFAVLLVEVVVFTSLTFVLVVLLRLTVGRKAGISFVELLPKVSLRSLTPTMYKPSQRRFGN